MKIVAYSDLHQHEYKSHSWLTEDGLNSRVVDTTNAVKKIYEHAGSIGAPVFFLGDMFQIKGEVPVTGFNELYNVISRRFCLVEGKVMDIMIPGNHDMATADGSRHALEVFNQGSNHVASAPVVLNPWPGIVIAAIPFPMENGKFSASKFAAAYNHVVEQVNRYDSTCTRILMSHCYTQELMKKYHDLSGDVVGRNLLVDFDIVLLGHHHIHDVIESEDGRKCVSVGAPLQHTFNDVGEKRGFVVVDTETREVEHHVLESRKFWAFDGEKAIVPEKAAGSFVRARVGSKTEGERVRKELEKAGAASITIEVVPKTPKKTRLDIKTGAKDDEIVQKFLESEFCTTELPKAELAGLARDYLAKVS